MPCLVTGSEENLLERDSVTQKTGVDPQGFPH